MADANNDVKALVEAELKKNPNISNDALREKARKLDKGVDALDRRQFNARYVLQAKRRLAPARRKGGARKRAAADSGRRQAKPAAANAGGTDRSAVRNVLVQFARDVVSAEEKADVVAVIGDVDKYVDRVIKATGGR